MALGLKQTLQPLGAQAIQRLRRQSEREQEQASQVKPLSSPLQAMAQMLIGAKAGWDERKADNAEKTNLATRQAALLQGLHSLDDTDTTPGGSYSGSIPASAASGISSSSGPSPSSYAMAPASLQPLYQQADSRIGIPGFSQRVATIESENRPDAKNPHSSAAGLFQFTNGTRGDYGNFDPMDPVASTQAFTQLTLDNKQALTQALGREPTAGELYLAHQQGAGGAIKLLRNQGASTASLVGGAAAGLNAGGGTTAGQFANQWTSKFADLPQPNSAQQAISAAAPVQVASLDPSAGMAAAAQQQAAPPAGLSTGPADPGANIVPLSYFYPGGPGDLSQTDPQQAASAAPMPQQAAPVPAIQPAPGASISGAAPFPDAPADSVNRWSNKVAIGDVGPALGDRQAVLGQMLQGGRLSIPGDMQTSTAAGTRPDKMAIIAKMLGDPNTEDIGNMMLTQELQQRNQKPFTVGDRLIDPRDYHVIQDFSKPAERWEPTTINGVPAQRSSVSGKVEAAPKADKPTPYSDAAKLAADQQAGFITPEQAAAGAQGQMPKPAELRQEIHQLPSYKNIEQAAPIYRSMVEAAPRATRASDLNLVYGLAKIMDPGSVVREGEIQMANDTQGIADQLNGYLQSLKGNSVLQPETRKALLDEAYGRMQGYNNAFLSDASQYQGIVQRYKMNPDDVIPSFGTFEPYSIPAAAPAAPAGAQGAPDPGLLEEMRRRGIGALGNVPAAASGASGRW